jgi:predicted outer membrane repeat protein
MAVMLFTATSAQAATYYVPDDYASIEAALFWSVSGDTIIVRDGVWKGAGNKNLDFAGKALTLRSENGPDNCIIDCQGSGRGFYFHTGEPPAAVLNGFTITNGNISGYGGAIYCYSSSPVISNCVITSSYATNGGGISCQNSSAPTISASEITGNVAEYNGGGIYCDTSSPTISGSAISDNVAMYGGGVYCYKASPSITGCLISGNTAQSGCGGGISLIDQCQPAITNCAISGNSGVHGGGIYCSGASTFPSITNCTISGNSATGIGGGIYCYSYSAPLVKNSILWGDSAPYGPEIALQSADDSSSLAVQYSDVQGGQAAAYVDTNCTLNWGSGNMDANPFFVGLGDYHLTSGSPCIDTGEITGAPDIDIDGDIRPINAGYDMGFDEYNNGPLACLSAISLENACEVGYNAPAQVFDITNCGGDILAYEITDDADWITCSPESGGSTGETDTITVDYATSALAAGEYSATIIVADPAAGNSPRIIDVNLMVMGDLSQINLLAPADGETLTSPPAFGWLANGGADNVFAVDFALSPSGPVYSTYENLHLLISSPMWIMPDSVWNKIPAGQTVYWRVRGADLDQTPMVVINSAELWTFIKE